MSEPKDFCYPCTNGQYPEDLEEENAKLREELEDVSGQRDSCIAVYEEQLTRMREELRSLTCNVCCGDFEKCLKPCVPRARYWQEKAEAAEAKLKAASEQEPEYYMLSDEGLWISINEESYDLCSDSHRMKCYAAPIPPADVQELHKRIKYLEMDKQSLNDTAMQYLGDRTDAYQRVAELERKLAEQQAFISECAIYQLGRQHQRESDAALCEKSDRYRGDYFAEKIRANTGESK